MNYTLKSEKYSIFKCVFIHCLSPDDDVNESNKGVEGSLGVGSWATPHLLF
jgi:hypothetical protein